MRMIGYPCAGWGIRAQEEPGFNQARLMRHGFLFDTMGHPKDGEPAFPVRLELMVHVSHYSDKRPGHGIFLRDIPPGRYLFHAVPSLSAFSANPSLIFEPNSDRMSSTYGISGFVSASDDSFTDTRRSLAPKGSRRRWARASRCSRSRFLPESHSRRRTGRAHT